MSDERTFSDEEVRRIFAAAADRQSRAEEEPGTALTRGTSLGQLKKIGAEAGIDPLHIEAAARSLGLEPTGERRPASVVHVERTVPFAADDATWERMVRVLREEFDAAGSTSDFGAVREWIGSTTGIRPTARIERTPGATTIGISGDMKEARQVGAVLGGTFGGVGLVLLVLMGLLGGDAVAATVAGCFALFGAAIYGVGRLVVPRMSARLETRLERVADRLELVARESEGRPPALDAG